MISYFVYNTKLVSSERMTSHERISNNKSVSCNVLIIYALISMEMKAIIIIFAPTGSAPATGIVFRKLVRVENSFVRNSSSTVQSFRVPLGRKFRKQAYLRKSRCNCFSNRRRPYGAIAPTRFVRYAIAYPAFADGSRARKLNERTQNFTAN